MADTTAWSTQSALQPAASGGLILTAGAHLTSSGINMTTNSVRASAYGQLMAAAADFKKVLKDFDPQADTDVATQITALLALL